uniref:Uncharacterized protein n=1 Tax=Anguilla anguilla TaxID=7936 RepID=A0A0E9TAP4_ANGAN
MFVPLRMMNCPGLQMVCFCANVHPLLSVLVQ